jgi:hypothetical protein
MNRMRALSIIQPWAHLIAIGLKDVENRTWATSHRGRVLLHASKRVDRLEFAGAMRIARDDSNPDFDLTPGDVAFGALIGHADIVDCVWQSDSPWFRGPRGFVLANAALWSAHVPCRGMPGLFDVDLDGYMRDLIQDAEEEQAEFTRRVEGGVM